MSELPQDPSSVAAACDWAPLRAELLEVEERYRANRIRVRPVGWPPGEAELALICRLLERTAAGFLRAAEAEREAMRAFFSTTDYLVRVASSELLGALSLRYHDTDERAALPLGIATVAMIFPHPDFRDLYLSLAYLYRVAGSRAAVAAALAEAAGPAAAGMLEFIGDFERTAFFAASVAPQLEE
jgi:hypothetical protein